MDPKTPQGRLVQLAERQGGAVSAAQLYALGFSAEQLKTMVRRGQLHRVFLRVYAVGHRNLSVRGRLWAARLAAGEGAFFSHRSGAAERRLRGVHDLSRIELTIPGATSTPARRPGLVLHRTTTPVDRTEARPLNGLLVATVPRLFVDLAGTERPGEVQRLITESVHTRQFDPDAVEAAIGRHARRPGMSMLKGALARYRPGPDRKSGLERSFQRYQVSDPRLPVPEYNQQLLGWEIDVLWRELGVCLELDGRNYHTAIEAFDRDRRKDRQLSVHRWRPVRVSDFEWEYDRPAVVQDLYALLGV